MLFNNLELYYSRRKAVLYKEGKLIIQERLKLTQIKEMT